MKSGLFCSVILSSGIGDGVLVALSFVLFVSMLVSLGKRPKWVNWMIGMFIGLAGIGGLCLYGYGYAHTGNMVLEKDWIQILARTMLAVSRMYAGINDFGTVQGAYNGSALVINLFWLVHLMAFYAMAGATVSALGVLFLRRFRAVLYKLHLFRKVSVIYGINSDTIELGRSMAAAGKRNLVFVGDKPAVSEENAIEAIEGIVRSDPSALKAESAFLKSILSVKGSPELSVYAIGGDESKNLAFAESLLNSLQQCNADPSKTKLVIRRMDESVECGLAGSEGHYGYGDVKCFTDVSMTARMLMQVMPPAEKMEFDTDGTAKGDFSAVVVGFGKTGRSILRQLVVNSQFVGSHFRAAVFALACDSESGFFVSSYPGLMKEYDISFYSDNAKSSAFYRYLGENLDSLRYVVLCTGDPKLDDELRSEIAAYLIQRNCDAAICSCSSHKIIWSSSPEVPEQTKALYQSDILETDDLDRMAMLLNKSYVNQQDISAEQAWAACDYFGKQSSRASADFSKAIMRMAGVRTDEVSDAVWQQMPQRLIENLGRAEHLRWCAFHYAMGFETMDMDTVRRRGEAYRAEVARNGFSNIRIGKDLAKRQHACLRGWDELDALAEVEEAYTGMHKDYKDMDIRNVMTIPRMLSAEE